MKLNERLAYAGVVAFFMAAQFPALAQTQRMRANITGGGGEGRCTYEVEVDGAAEVEIHGDQGDLRTTSGSPAQWRRLECNQVLPNNPGAFRFQGVDGRGRQQLVRDPNATGGVAVIRIEDPQGGSQGYTGAIAWSGGSNNWGGVGNWASGGYSSGEWGQRITPSEAMNICRNQVVATRNIPRARVRVQPATQPGDGNYAVNFSVVNNLGGTKNGVCSVSGSGQILQFQIDQGQEVGRASWNQALDTCQNETAKRFGVSGGDVRVQHGADPGNGSYLVNFQAKQRNGKIVTGVCRVSPTGENEAFQRW
jgi:hypothetical protein